MKHLFIINFSIAMTLGIYGKRLCDSDIRGSKGEKGNVGECSSTILSNRLTAAMFRGFMELEDGWIAPFNGYQYKVHLNETSFNESRNACRSWGGDLIVYGCYDFSTVQTLNSAFGLSDLDKLWIGLFKDGSQWQWLSGRTVSTNDETLWQPGKPSSSPSDNNCGAARFSDANDSGYNVYDKTCSSNLEAICEKRV